MCQRHNTCLIPRYITEKSHRCVNEVHEYITNNKLFNGANVQNNMFFNDEIPLPFSSLSG